jgi:hypothetical protein
VLEDGPCQGQGRLGAQRPLGATTHQDVQASNFSRLIYVAKISHEDSRRHQTEARNHSAAWRPGPLGFLNLSLAQARHLVIRRHPAPTPCVCARVNLLGNTLWVDGSPELGGDMQDQEPPAVLRGVAEPSTTEAQGLVS